MAQRYAEVTIPFSGYYESETDYAPELDFLERKRSALEMILSRINSLMEQREDIFKRHKTDLETRIAEFNVRLKMLMPGNQLNYPPQAVFELERHKVMHEKELRQLEIGFMQDILHLDDRMREIILQHGNILALGDRDFMERQGGGL